MTIKDRADQAIQPIAGSVAIGKAVYAAEAHAGIGGSGSAACAQITGQTVAAAMGIPTERIAVTVAGELNLRGALGACRRENKCTHLPVFVA